MSNNGDRRLRGSQAKRDYYAKRRAERFARSLFLSGQTKKIARNER